ncbi:hypothetical protein GGF50DRAFT_121580 [Schizophyllum commune]
MPISQEDVVQLSTDIKALAKQLPSSVPIASKDGMIYRILRDSHGESAWATFNKRFDALYGEECRDADGKLKNIERGKYGLDGVCKYLDIAVQQGSMPYDLMSIKLERLKLAMQVICVPPNPTGSPAAREAAIAPSLPKPKRARVVDTQKAAIEALHKIGDGSLAGYLMKMDAAPLPGDSRKDKTYKPPAGDQESDDSDIGMAVQIGSGGEEVDSDVQPATKKRRRAQSLASISSDDSDIEELDAAGRARVKAKEAAKLKPTQVKTKGKGETRISAKGKKGKKKAVRRLLKW